MEECFKQNLQLRSHEMEREKNRTVSKAPSSVLQAALLIRERVLRGKPCCILWFSAGRWHLVKQADPSIPSSTVLHMDVKSRLSGHAQRLVSFFSLPTERRRALPLRENRLRLFFCFLCICVRELAFLKV